MQKTTLVLGASTNLSRYSAIAIERLLKNGIEVRAIGAREGQVYGIEIQVGLPVLKDIHTVSLYLSKKHQEGYIDYIIGLAPKRVIFNPGTENQAFVLKLNEAGIEAEIACTLVLLSTDQY